METPLALVGQTAGVLGTSEHTKAESRISNYFSENARGLIQEIGELYPDRIEILNDALKAHIEGKYTLSIPVFLTQADGIGAGFFGFDSIYTVSDANFKKIKQKYEEQDDAFRVKYLYFLSGTLSPLNASRKKREHYSAPFNRHLIIHGESTDYQTEINSLKAISWLKFVTEVANPL